MFLPSKRSRSLLAGLGLLLLGAGALVAFRLVREVNRALAVAPGSSAALSLVPVPEPAQRIERWGGGEVTAVAGSGAGLSVAGGFGLRTGEGDVAWALPSLRASALALWRGRAVLGLEAGGLFLRRDGQWEELLCGFGTLHVRALQEDAGGRLWIGAREGLFRVAWAASAMERLDSAPVRSIALGGGELMLAGGEEGLRQVEPGRVTLLATPDPWIEWVGLCGKELWALTPAGLARGAPGGALVRVAGGEDVVSAAVASDRVYALGGGRILRFQREGRPLEEFPPAPPVKLLAAAGQLFADTRSGLYRQTASGWELAQPRPSSLPPGSAHVGALGQLGGRLALGVFNGGLALGAPGTRGWVWSSLPGPQPWAVNALLGAGSRLYVASLRGAAHFDEHGWSDLGGSASGPAFALAATPGGVAVGYGQGVLLPGTGLLSAFHGLPGNQALALAGGNPLFVGTPSGLGAIHDGKVAWRVTAGEGRLPHPWVTALALRAEALYIGTYGGGVVRRVEAPGQPKGQFTPFSETAGFKVNTGCLVEAGGRLFLGTDGQGLFRLSRDGTRFEPLRLPLPSRRVTALLALAGSLYVGTDEGLARLPLPLPDEGS